MALETAPVDWGAWMSWVRVVASRRHGGLRGWADEGFYARLERFATDHAAPAGLLASLRFERAVRAHDWAAAATAAVELVPMSSSPGSALEPWIDAQLTLDGGVTALLVTDQVREARRLFDALSPRVRSPDNAFMAFLLPAYLEYAEASGALTGAGREAGPGP